MGQGLTESWSEHPKQHWFKQRAFFACVCAVFVLVPFCFHVQFFVVYKKKTTRKCVWCSVKQCTICHGIRVILLNEFQEFALCKYFSIELKQIAINIIYTVI